MCGENRFLNTTNIAYCDMCSPVETYDQKYNNQYLYYYLYSKCLVSDDPIYASQLIECTPYNRYIYLWYIKMIKSLIKNH